MKRIKIIVFFLLFTGIFTFACTPPPVRIEPFAWTKVLPGDGRVTVQWWLTEKTLNDWSTIFNHFELMRAEEGEKFEKVGELGPVSPPPSGWCLTDSTAENGKTYQYYIHAVFALYDDPDAEGFSDTLTVTPETGLADPRPLPPANFTFDPLVEFSDTVILRWDEPDKHDSLYYLFMAPSSAVEFSIYIDNFDGTGRLWAPSGNEYHPARFDSTSFLFQCTRDGNKRYYKILIFADSIMSYPSEVLEIEHTWQPPLLKSYRH